MLSVGMQPLIIEICETSMIIPGDEFFGLGPSALLT
jgi:hypothetical protein